MDSRVIASTRTIFLISSSAANKSLSISKNSFELTELDIIHHINCNFIIKCIPLFPAFLYQSYNFTSPKKRQKKEVSQVKIDIGVKIWKLGNITDYFIKDITLSRRNCTNLVIWVFWSTPGTSDDILAIIIHCFWPAGRAWTSDRWMVLHFRGRLVEEETFFGAHLCN